MRCVLLLDEDDAERIAKADEEVASIASMPR